MEKIEILTEVPSYIKKNFEVLSISEKNGLIVHYDQSTNEYKLYVNDLTTKFHNHTLYEYLAQLKEIEKYKKEIDKLNNEHEKKIKELHNENDKLLMKYGKEKFDKKILASLCFMKDEKRKYKELEGDEQSNFLIECLEKEDAMRKK